MNKDNDKKSCAMNCMFVCVCDPEMEKTKTVGAYLPGYDTCESRSTSFYDACTGMLKIGTSAISQNSGSKSSTSNTVYGAFLPGYETCESRSTSWYDACTGKLKTG
ncbi:hypothetical protein BT69DRAFT_1276771 [Atractiella rhizophila]|nr:hypothetical protein BT69DRAFT_1276771 [Atractiella rhizophila]